MIKTFKIAATGFVLVSAIAQGYSTPQGSYMQGQPGAYQSYPAQPSYPSTYSVQPSNPQGYQGDIYSNPSYPQGYSTQAPIQQQYEVYDGRAAVRPSWGGDNQLDQRRPQDQRIDMQNQRNLNQQRFNQPENRNLNQPQQFRAGERRPLLADSNTQQLNPRDTDSKQMNSKSQMNARDMDSSTNDDAYKVRRALQNDSTLSINARNIRVALNSDSQLILTGNVRDEAERKRVEEIAIKSTGIQNVINKLQIASY